MKTQHHQLLSYAGMMCQAASSNRGIKVNFFKKKFS